MKVLRDLIVSAVISLEFLAGCIITGLTYWLPGILRAAGTGLESHSEAYQWLSIACVGVVIFALRWGHEILVPKQEQSKILSDWPGFYLLKNRTLVGVCYAVSGAAVAVAIWIFNVDIKRADISAVYCAAVIIVIIAALSLWYGSVQLGIRLRRVLN